MAIALVLDEIPSEPLMPRNIILDGRVQTFDSGSVKLWYWRWNDDEAMEWQFLGESKVGSQLDVTFPFDVTTRPIRVGYVLRTDAGVNNATDLRRMVQTVYPQAPTLTSATFNAPDIDLVFFKNGLGTGNIKVEYRAVGDTTVWLLHATDFAHGATTGSITIAALADSVTYQIRLYQVDVDGYSNTIEVTVTGSGADDPPSNLTIDSQTEVSPGEWEIDLSWDAGTGAGDYTVEIRSGAGTWFVLASGVAALVYVDTRFGNPHTNVNWSYRVKQEDVDGYSNEVVAFVPRFIETP